MASLNLVIDDADVPKLQAALDFYNTQHATTLTIKQWAARTLHDAFKDLDKLRQRATLSDTDVNIT
jgi:hypothetical protein